MKLKKLSDLSKKSKIIFISSASLSALLVTLTFLFYLNKTESAHPNQASIKEVQTLHEDLGVDLENQKQPPKLGPAVPSPSHGHLKIDNSGTVPVISNITTDQKVVFLTIDDGGVKKPDMLALLENNGIKASLFLTNISISDNYDFFKPFMSKGMPIQNHTLSHQYARPGSMSYETQKNEICGMSDKIEKIYGTRPTLYRPPGGWVDQNTALIAKQCGMKAVVLWIAKANNGSMQFQVGKTLRPGDIVLMHFREKFAEDLAAFKKAQDEAGLTTDYLENWI